MDMGKQQGARGRVGRVGTDGLQNDALLWSATLENKKSTSASVGPVEGHWQLTESCTWSMLHRTQHMQEENEKAGALTNEQQGNESDVEANQW